MKDSISFLSSVELEEKFDINASDLAFYGLISTLKALKGVFKENLMIRL